MPLLLGNERSAASEQLHGLILKYCGVQQRRVSRRIPNAAANLLGGFHQRPRIGSGPPGNQRVGIVQWHHRAGSGRDGGRGLQRAAHGRSVFDNGEGHAWHHGIQAILGAAVHLGR